MHGSIPLCRHSKSSNGSFLHVKSHAAFFVLEKVSYWWISHPETKLSLPLLTVQHWKSCDALSKTQRLGLLNNDVILLCDNARPQAACVSHDLIRSFSWLVGTSIASISLVQDLNVSVFYHTNFFVLWHNLNSLRMHS